MINKFAIYYVIIVFIIIVVSKVFIIDASVSKYNKHMLDIYNDSTKNEISEILDKGIENVENIVDSITGGYNTKSKAKNNSNNSGILQFEVYMPQEIITDVDMKLERFLLIENLVMERTMLLDKGAIAYFIYTFKEKRNNIDPEILCNPNCYEIEHFNKTDPNKINGLILEKELFLEDGAIFYFKYKF